jgi:hypothetical protein
MFNQLSGVVLVDFAILTAISGVKLLLPFISPESVFLETPRFYAASVIEIFNSLITSSNRTSPGCVGFLVFINSTS